MILPEVMTLGVEYVSPAHTIEEEAWRMRSLDVGSEPVRAHDRLVGVLTGHDITVRVTADGRDSKTTRVGEVMNQDVISCFEERIRTRRPRSFGSSRSTASWSWSTTSGW